MCVFVYFFCPSVVVQGGSSVLDWFREPRGKCLLGGERMHFVLDVLSLRVGLTSGPLVKIIEEGTFLNTVSRTALGFFHLPMSVICISSFVFLVWPVVLDLSALWFLASLLAYQILL